MPILDVAIYSYLIATVTRGLIIVVSPQLQAERSELRD